MQSSHATDVLIVGSGVAGLSLALRLADSAKVTVLAKADLTQGSSLYAQGGVAAVLNNADTFGAHIQDTLQAGGGLCHPDIVEFTVQRGPAAIRWLIDQGVGFTRELGPDGRPHYHLTREGGHSHRRGSHAAHATRTATGTTPPRPGLRRVIRSTAMWFSSRVIFGCARTRPARVVSMALPVASAA